MLRSENIKAPLGGHAGCCHLATKISQPEGVRSTGGGSHQERNKTGAAIRPLVSTPARGDPRDENDEAAQALRVDSSAKIH